MSKKKIKEYYTDYGIGEWERLNRDPYHKLEFNTSVHFLKKYFPKKGLVLDAGGGPGRYTIELAKLGHELILFDLTPELLKIADKKIKKEKVQDRVKKIIQGSIDDLSVFEDNKFDAVICLGGVLSHLLDEKQREKAVDELVRVAKKNSIIYVSVISRLAVLVSELVNFPEEIQIKKVFQSVRDSGDYRGGYGFTSCHFFFVEELKKLFKKKKVKIIEMVGLEGLSSNYIKETNKLFKKYPKSADIWWETHLKTCAHPAVVEMSPHFMIICKKL